MAVAHLSCLIVNTSAGCYSYGQTLALNTVTLSLTCMFQQRKRECFEHERCSTMVKSLMTVYMITLICCLCLHVFVFRTWCLMGSCCLCLHSVFSVFTYMCFPCRHIYIYSVSVYTVLSVYMFCCWLLGSGGQRDPAVSLFTQVLPLAPQAVSGFPGLLDWGKGCQHRGCISQTGCYRHLVR